MSESGNITLDAEKLAVLVADIFRAEGVDARASETVAQALVDADLEGQHSHGVMLIDLYVGRLRAGSVSKAASAEIVHDQGVALVLDAHNALGHLTGDQAMTLAVERARELGAGIAAVRNGFHFGTARRFALYAAAENCIGIAMCNTRPLMPAPGGAERLAGNNPLAIAMPAGEADPLVLDMALSEAAMGKIRLAAAQGEAIPGNWAADADGAPTTDANRAIEGMLLPAGGPKGFGLAVMIDLLCGLLSGGGWGDEVTPLYGDFAQGYNCSHLFMAIDTAHFGAAEVFAAGVQAAAVRINSSRPAPGVARVFAPGEIERAARAKAEGKVSLTPATIAKLSAIAGELNVSANGLEQAFAQAQKDNIHVQT